MRETIYEGYARVQQLRSRKHLTWAVYVRRWTNGAQSRKGVYAVLVLGCAQAISASHTTDLAAGTSFCSQPWSAPSWLCVPTPRPPRYARLAHAAAGHAHRVNQAKDCCAFHLDVATLSKWPPSQLRQPLHLRCAH